MSFGKGGGGGGKSVMSICFSSFAGKGKVFGPGRRRKEKQVLSSLYIPLMIFLGETFANLYSRREITFSLV